MLALLITLSVLGLVAFVLYLAERLDKAIDKAIHDAFGSLDEEDLQPPVQRKPEYKFNMSEAALKSELARGLRR